MKMFIHSFMLATKINNISLLTRQTNKTYYNLSQIDQTQNTKYRNRYQTNKQTNQLKLIYIEPTTHININNIIWHFVCLCVRQRFSYICMYCGIIALRICVCVCGCGHTTMLYRFVEHSAVCQFMQKTFLAFSKKCLQTKINQSNNGVTMKSSIHAMSNSLSHRNLLLNMCLQMVEKLPMFVVSVYSIGMMCMCDAMLLRGRNGSADGSRVCWCLCLRMCYLQAVPCAVNRSPVVCSHTQTHTSHMCTVDRGCGETRR